MPDRRSGYDRYADYTERKPVRAGILGIGVVWTWVVVAVVLFAILGAGVWLVGVATSDVHGRGEVKKQTNSANNRIATSSTSSSSK